MELITWVIPIAGIAAVAFALYLARDVLSRDTDIDDLDGLRRKVAPYRAHLDLIAANPGVHAPDLAAQLGLETLTFKRQVRRLKELGLTHSLPVGYRLSPRGRMVVENLAHQPQPPRTARMR